MTKENYAELNNLIDRMLEASATTEEYSKIEKQLNERIREFSKDREAVKKQKIEQARNAALAKICDGIIDFVKTFDEIEMDPEEEAELRQTLWVDTKVSLDKLIKDLTELIRVEKMLEKENNRLNPEYKDVKIQRVDGDADPLKEYINNLLNKI